MGNTSWDIPQTGSSGRYMLDQSFSSSLPTSPMKPALTSLHSAIPQTGAGQLGQPNQDADSSVHRRHSVAGQRPLSKSLRNKNPDNMIFHHINSDMSTFMDQSDFGFSELEDFSDGSSTSTSSPICHRKVERSRSEPKAPAELINRVHHKSGGSTGSTGSQQNVGDKRYKTEMCRSFLEGRECTYKEKCRYAHGEYEIRPVVRHPKYRTEYCRPFHATGICSYGHRCNFIHDDGPMQRRISSSSMSESQSVSPRLSPTGNALGLNAAGTGRSSGRPRAISLSAEAMGFSLPVENFIAEQRREMGSIGDSLTSSSGFASYPSSPMSISPAADGMDVWFTHHRSTSEVFSSSNDLIPVSEEGPWMENLSAFLQTL